MTTPNQDAPDGAVTIGGNSWNYGQLVDEKYARSSFEIEPPSNLPEALELLPTVLAMIPSDGLKPWQKWLNLVDQDRADRTTFVEKIMESIGKNRLTKTEENTQGVVDGIEKGIKGGNPVGRPVETVRENLQDAWTKIWRGHTGQPGADKFPSDIEVAAALVASSAGSANTQAGAAVTTAGEAVGRADDAFDKADGAETKALDAVELAGQTIEAGSNLIANSDFEKGLVSPQPLAGIYSTDQKYSGTRSLRMQANGTIKTFYLLSEGLTPRTIPATEDDVFYCELYLYCSGVTQSVADGFRLVFEPTNRLGGNLTDAFVGQNVSTALNGVWTRVAGYVRLPPGTTKFRVGVQIRNTVSAGLFFVDQAIVREITVAKAAQDNLDTKARDLSNLAGGSDFEGEQQPWTLGTGWSIATDQRYVGTRSFKHTGTLAGTSTLAGTFACLPGEQFLVECYALKDSAFNGSTSDKIRFLNQAGTEVGSLVFGSAAIGPANVWVRLFTTITIPAGTNAFTVTAVSNSTNGSVWLDNIVIRRIVTSDLIGVLPQSKVDGLQTGLSTIDGKAQGAIDGIGQGIDGGTATYTAPTVKTRLQLAWANLWDGLSGNTGSTSKLPWQVRDEAAKVKSKADTAALSAGTANDTNTELIDNINTAMNGEDGLTNTTVQNVLATLRKTFKELSDNTTSLAELRARRDGTAVKGASYTVNFSSFSSMAQAGFTVLPSGTGASQIGIIAGIAQWSVADTLPKDAKIIYGQSTATDFQAVRGTMSAPPQPATLNGTAPYFYAIARVSPDGQNYVWARAYAQSLGVYRADMGYAVNGAETTWVTNIPLTWSLDMRFVAGVGTNVREYQLWSGNTLVRTFTESGTASRLCSNAAHTTAASHDDNCVKWRQWGAIAQVRNGRTAGKVAACVAYDNGTPSVNGSFARMVRKATGPVTYVANNTLTPLNNNFFDDTPYESVDVDSVASNGTFRVNTAKPYFISARVALSGNAAALGYLLLQVSSNGSTWTTVQYGPANVTNDGQPLQASWLQYLTAGQYVRLAYTRNGSIALNVLTGEPSGSQTYFTIAGVEGADA